MKDLYFIIPAVALLLGGQAAYAAGVQRTLAQGMNEANSSDIQRGIDPDFQQFYDYGCRTTRGGKGSEASGEFDLVEDVSHHTCRRNCLNKGQQCFGYEYAPLNKWCELWKVPIGESKLEYVRGKECYTKMGSAENGTPEPTPYPAEHPTDDPADDGSSFGLRSSFNLNQDTACRTSSGDKGSEASGDFDLIKDVSRQACNRECLNKGKQCFGYEYSTRKKWCEVWKVPIGESKLDYVRGTKCYIKTNGDTTEPTPYPTEAPTFRPTDDTYYFDLNQGMGCRTRRGGKGSEASGDFDLIDDVSRQACKKKCVNKGKKCFGYEYSSRKKECEVWKVPIGESKLQYERGKECYIKTDSDTPEPTPYPTEAPTFYPTNYETGDPYYFDFNHDMGCRTSEGKKGSQKNGDFALYKRVTLGMCEGECLNLGQLCSGYEYGSSGRCEVWKVHIDRIKLEHVRGNDCYIRV